MGVWHECEELDKRKGLIRKYIWGETWLGMNELKNTVIRDIKFCPFCGIKLEDLK